MQLQLINHLQYPFLADIPLDAPPQTTTITHFKVSEIAILFFESFYRGVIETAGYSRQIFIGTLMTNGYIPLNPGIFVFKLILGVLTLGVSVIFATHRIMKKALSAPKDNDLLVKFISPHLNPNHIKSDETTLNVRSSCRCSNRPSSHLF